MFFSIFLHLSSIQFLFGMCPTLFILLILQKFIKLFEKFNFMIIYTKIIL
uniref:Uncharacterized protein n=1 Tax=Meloidogyne enterolobii TaxID=390850 RepID=A0A6V7VRW1_MELEN|nr:unnamed protein product [Meloidogyne enterolobii]